MKNKNIAAALAILGGTLGLHKFYLGRWIQGVLYIVFSATMIPTILGVLEGLVYLINTKQWFDINYNAEYIKNKQLIDGNKETLRM